MKVNLRQSIHRLRQKIAHPSSSSKKHSDSQRPIQRTSTTDSSDEASDSSTCNHNMSHYKGNDLAAEDKKMEERAKRAKELLSMRYKGLKHEQVRLGYESLCLYYLYKMCASSMVF